MKRKRLEVHDWSSGLSDLTTFIPIIIESTFTNHYFLMRTILCLIFQSSCSTCRWYLNISIMSGFIQTSHWIILALIDGWMNNNSAFETGCWEHSSTSVLEFNTGRKEEMIDSSQWLHISSSCIWRRSSEDKLLWLQSRLTDLKITNCRETRKQTNSSQRDSDSSEEIFKGQLVDLVTFSLSCPVVMKALYLTGSNSVFTHMYFTTEIL